MSRALAYRVAECFIENLKQSACFNISSNGINALLQHASPEVSSYFKKEGKDDVLFIFKQFPDVFLLIGSNITLTDAFLALYAFPESAEFRPTYKCHSLFEASVIEYIKLILVRCGMCNYLKPIKIMLTQNNLLANYFSNYTEADMYAFFQKYTSTFTLKNNNVYLNRTAQIHFETFDDHFCKKSFKKLAKATNFLLTCFDFLHYIELRQVISFVRSDVMDYLNMYSLIKQREIFENLPDTAMDKMGYVSLKNFESLLPSSKELRLILLIVCILAFERELHFSKIGKEIKKRVPLEVSSILCNLSVSKQFKYFKELSDFFSINGDGYVTLLPSFIFPACTFDSGFSNSQNDFRLQPSTFTSKSKDVDILKGVKKLSITPNHKSNSRKSAIGANTSPGHLKIKNSYNSSCTSAGLQNAKNNLPVLKGSTCLVNARLKLSMIFLMGSFQAPICKNILKSCFFVLHDIQVSFLKMPLVQQINYVKECQTYFDSLLKEGLLNGVPSMQYINDREQVLLFIVHALINEKTVLFEKLSCWLDSRKIDSAFSKFSVSDKLLYFKSMSGYLTVVNGNVSLNKMFDSVNTLVDSHYDILLKLSLESEDSTLIKSKGKSPKTSSKENFVHNILPSTSEFSVNELNMPLDIYKKLQLSIIYLQKWFDILCTEDILQTFLYAMNDIRTYFVKLSTTQQEMFVLNYFQHTSSKSFSNVTSLKNSQLTEKEKALLATTYLLVQNKTMHYEKIVKKLRAFKISASVYGENAKQQFKFFKTLNNYFDVMSRNAQVIFSSSYYFLMSIINPILMNIKLRKNIVTVNDSNNIAPDSKQHFVCKNVFPESEKCEKNKSTDNNLKHSCFSRRPTIRTEFLKRLSHSLKSRNNTNAIAQQTDVLKIKPNKIRQTIENMSLKSSINTPENTVDKNSDFEFRQGVSSKHQTGCRDSLVSGADLMMKNDKKSVANSKSSLSGETKNISEEIQHDHAKNHCNPLNKSEYSKISSMASGNYDRSHDYKLKQNLNTPSMQENIFRQSSIKDCDDKDLFSDDDDLDPYTLYGLELLSSFMGESVPHTSSCIDHNVNSQNCPAVYNYDCHINNQKVSSASSSSSFSAQQQDNMKADNQVYCKAMPSKSKVPLKQLPRFDDVEIQAVNFFSVILRNYGTGVSADFLVKRLNLASESVQNFMLSSFQGDAISFFVKHEAVFHVSPDTKNIYLV